MNKNHNIQIVVHKATNGKKENHSQSCQQLELFSLSTLPQKRQKPQISSIPGVSLKERNRYRVMLGNAILGDWLTVDEAIRLAKRGER